jgi:predicted Zn-dependent peptidase
LATLSSAALGLLAVSVAFDARAEEKATGLNVPFEKYQLDNGLTVILAPDHTVPIVSVNNMVRVGSRFEVSGRTGFAHLFEHLMFMGTDRVPTGVFDQTMEKEGGWNNAWTSEDRTDYFEVGPAHVLPLFLWLEADRLSALGSTMTQEKLDAQRNVVRNERRQRSENEPYAKVELRLPELLYPEGHPYHHPVIGSHADLEAANVADVKRFFAEHYVPNNMSLVVAGDFDVATTKADVQRLFSGLASAKVPDAPPATMPKLSGVVRETIEDDVELPKLVFAWHSPARFAPGDAELDILSNVLTKGKTSRLYKSLVFDKEIAQSVSASQLSQDLSSYFEIDAFARPGVSLDELEKGVLAGVKDVLDKGVTGPELERAKNDYETDFVRGIESIENRASLLNTYETFMGDPGYLAKDLERYRRVDADGVRAAARASLDPNALVIIRVVPRAKVTKEQPAKGGAK